MLNLNKYIDNKIKINKEKIYEVLTNEDVIDYSYEEFIKKITNNNLNKEELIGCLAYLDFNPLIGEEREVVDEMTYIFEQLNPDSPVFFKDMQAILLRNSLPLLKRLMKDNATLKDLNLLINNPEGIGKKIVIELFPNVTPSNEKEALGNNQIYSYFIKDYFKENSKTYQHCNMLRHELSKIISKKELKNLLDLKR